MCGGKRALRRERARVGAATNQSWKERLFGALWAGKEENDAKQD